MSNIVGSQTVTYFRGSGLRGGDIFKYLMGCQQMSFDRYPAGTKIILHLQTYYKQFKNELINPKKKFSSDFIPKNFSGY